MMRQILNIKRGESFWALDAEWRGKLSITAASDGSLRFDVDSPPMRVFASQESFHKFPDLAWKRNRD